MEISVASQTNTGSELEETFGPWMVASNNRRRRIQVRTELPHGMIQLEGDRMV